MNTIHSEIFEKHTKKLDNSSKSFYNLIITLYTSTASALILLAFKIDIAGSFQKIFYLTTLFLSIALIALVMTMRFWDFLINKSMMLFIMKMDSERMKFFDKRLIRDITITDWVKKVMGVFISFIPMVMYLFIILQLVSAFLLTLSKLY